MGEQIDVPVDLDLSDIAWVHQVFQGMEEESEGDAFQYTVALGVLGKRQDEKLVLRCSSTYFMQDDEGLRTVLRVHMDSEAGSMESASRELEELADRTGVEFSRCVVNSSVESPEFLVRLRCKGWAHIADAVERSFGESPAEGGD